MSIENKPYESGQVQIPAAEFVQREIAPPVESGVDPKFYERLWRLNNLYFVVNEQGELVKFKLRPAQEYLMKNLHYRNVILKARQLGFTTFICIFFLDYALFHRHKQMGIIADTEDNATVIFRKIKVAWDNMPSQVKELFRLAATKESTTEFQFTSESTIRVATSLRSGTYQGVLVTELGKISKRFPERASEIVTGTFPAVPSTGLLFVESTAEGDEGEFYDIVTGARELEEMKRPLSSKEFKFFFFAWWQNPANTVNDYVGSRDVGVDEYLTRLEQQLGITLTKGQRDWYFLEGKTQKEKMKQEHPSSPDEAFAVSGNKLFTADVIDILIQRDTSPPVQVIGDLRVWKGWQRGHIYGGAGDVSEGVGRDSSTIAILDFTLGEVVATYRNNQIGPVDFASDMAKVGNMYGGCVLAPESNNHGFTTCVTLHAIYPNMYTQIRQGALEDKPTEKLGWLSTGGTKPKMMYELSQAFENGDLKCYDRAVLLEAKKFSKDDAVTLKTKETTRHFDLLTAVAIAWQMRSYATAGRSDDKQMAQITQHRQDMEQKSIKKTHRYR